jgi:hypothetical protein
MCTQHSLLLWRARQHPRESSEQGAPFLRNRRPYQLLRRQRDCYGKASSGVSRDCYGGVLCAATVEVEVGGFLFFKTGTV